jgi:Flp pilus assembly protein TadD
MDELDWEAGLAEMREAARLNPRSYQSFGNIGVCLLKLNRNEEAREALEQALEINPKYAIALNNLRILANKEI